MGNCSPHFGHLVEYLDFDHKSVFERYTAMIGRISCRWFYFIVNFHVSNIGEQLFKGLVTSNYLPFCKALSVN